jgi:hypothetical protein
MHEQLNIHQQSDLIQEDEGDCASIQHQSDQSALNTIEAKRNQQPFGVIRGT